jgi:hypothetical protein
MAIELAVPRLLTPEVICHQGMPFGAICRISYVCFAPILTLKCSLKLTHLLREVLRKKLKPIADMSGRESPLQICDPNHKVG